jgi:soluble lytic murein transglycosylase-like protein
MDFVLGSLALMELIVGAAGRAPEKIPAELILAIVEVESGGEPFAARIVPNYPYTMPRAKRPAGVERETERYMQKTAWGLTQVMGATARSVGFEGYLPELTDPAINVETGVAYLRELARKYGARHGLEGIIAAYNGGAPRKRPDGKFHNQGYVDRVLKAMEKYRSVVMEREKEGEAGKPDDDKSDPAAAGKPRRPKDNSKKEA